MARTIDQIVARLKNKHYTNTDELAQDIASATSAISRLNSQERGLDKNIVAGIHGGTTLGVGDPSATHLSDYLVQNPQQGIPSNVGGTLETTRRTRIEMRTRTVPGIVTADAAAGAATVSVEVAGNVPFKSSDPATDVETVGNPFSELDSVSQSSGTAYQATVSGGPLVDSGEGYTPPVVGQIVPVTISEQWQVDTTATKRNKKWSLNVVRMLKNDSAVVCTGWRMAGCTPALIETHEFASHSDPDWFYAGGTGPYPYAERPYAIIIFNTTNPPGTYDRPAGGWLSHHEQISTAAGMIFNSGVNAGGASLYPPWRYYFLFGCQNGATSVTFGTHDGWTFTDSAFPFPLPPWPP